MRILTLQIRNAFPVFIILSCDVIQECYQVFILEQIQVSADITLQQD